LPGPALLVNASRISTARSKTGRVEPVHNSTGVATFYEITFSPCRSRWPRTFDDDRVDLSAGPWRDGNAMTDRRFFTFLVTTPADQLHYASSCGPSAIGHALPAASTLRNFGTAIDSAVSARGARPRSCALRCLSSIHRNSAFSAAARPPRIIPTGDSRSCALNGSFGMVQRDADSVSAR